VATTRGGQAPPVDFQILPARELPVNDHFANALNLSGSTATSTSHNWGASTEPGEPESHSRSLWWRWTAPKSGAVKISTNGIPALYCGAVLSELEPVRLAADATRSFIVEKDTSYQLAVSTYSSPSEVSVNLEMSPTGDYFSDPIILPSTDWHALFLNLQDFSKEELEPPHAGGPPVASAWIHLTAPHSGHFQILSNANRAFRIAVYEGNRIASLSPVSEGVAEVGFHAVGGTSYRIVFDKQSDSSSGLLDFMIFADPAGYSDWIAGFFLNPQVADASPSSDPDHDQRSNFFERAFGSHPLIADREPIPYSMNRDGDFIVLSVTRPIGITDLRYAFDVSRDLNGWTGTEMLNTEPWTEDHGDGTETLFIRLLDYAPATEPHFYYRLRVDEVPSE